MSDGGAEGFDAWFACYPRKTRREATLASYGAVLGTGIEPHELLERTKAWLRQEGWPDKAARYFPAPAKFLDEGEWKSMTPEVRAAGESPGVDRSDGAAMARARELGLDPDAPEATSWYRDYLAAKAGDDEAKSRNNWYEGFLRREGFLQRGGA